MPTFNNYMISASVKWWNISINKVKKKNTWCKMVFGIAEKKRLSVKTRCRTCDMKQSNLKI